MDDHATTSDYNDFRHSEDCREHYLHVLEDSIYRYYSDGPQISEKLLGFLCKNLRKVKIACHGRGHGHSPPLTVQGDKSTRGH